MLVKQVSPDSDASDLSHPSTHPKRSFVEKHSGMGQAATKAQEARAQARSKPKTGRSVQQQKIKTARATGVLALPDSKLKAVPSEVATLPKLTTLDLSRNRLVDLPRELNALTALKTLKVPGNALTSLPDLSGLVSLTTVRLPACLLAW